MNPKNKRFLIILISTMILSIITGCIFDSDEEGTTESTPPSEPFDPNPANNATNVADDVYLSWDCTDTDEVDTLSFQVYFGTETDPPAVEPVVTDFQYNPDLVGNTTYYWKVVAMDIYGNETEGPIWRFTTTDAANTAPETPANPDPANGVSGVEINTSLSWTCTDPDQDALEFDVYFDSDTITDGFAQVADRQTALSYQPSSSLDSATTYYWKVIAYDNYSHVTEGPTWQFLTVVGENNPPNMPQIGGPDSAATNVALSGVVLSWSCSDPEDDELTYNVYFGNDDSPDLVSEQQSDLTYTLSSLSAGTTYYWRIVAYDDSGDSTRGGLWYFTTQASGDAFVYYGNPDGTPVSATVGERFDLDVYFYTQSDVYVGNILLALGVSGQYVDSLLNADDNDGAQLLYPFNEWDVVYFNSINEYQTNWFCEPMQGYAELYGPYESPALHFETPTLALKLKMRAIDNSNYTGQTVDAFDYGQDPIQGSSNMSDTSGAVNFDVVETFNQLYFEQ